MIRWLALLICLPLSAWADPVSIRSGDHDTFSRLVISIGEGTGWQVQPTDGGYTLNLNGAVEGFDTSSVFDRIPRDRIAAVTQQTERSLFLAVDCACYADAFLWRPGQLVLDVVEGVGPDAVERPRLRPQTTLASDVPLRRPETLSLQDALQPEGSPLIIPSTLQAPPPASPTPNVQSTDLRATEAALLEGLSRAAAQGFLDAAIQPTPTSQPAPIVVTEPEEPRDLPGPPLVVGQPGIGISTAMDRDLALLGDAISEELGQQCLPAALFQIHDWATDQAFHTQVAALAEGLAGEFGEEPREAQDALARLYLYFGFGAEARLVLSADPAISQSRQIMNELADIVDGEDGPFPFIRAQSGCPTPAMLWSFYVDPSPHDAEASLEILQHFFALPQPLRGQIAPSLAQKFIELSDHSTASKIMRAALNMDVENSHDVQATRARIAEEIDDPKEAIVLLEEQADDNARTSPASVIRLIELVLDQGQAPKESDLELAAAMRQEYRSEDIALDLALAEAKGRIERGDYRAALTLVDDREDAGAVDVRNAAYDHLTKNAVASNFLEYAFEQLPDDLSATTQNEMAARLIELGFSERAQGVLSGPADRQAAAERRYLRAEAAIGVQDYDTVIEELLGLSDPRAQSLRSRAFAGMGEHRSALVAARGVEQADSTTLQFRAEAWERLTIEEDEALSTFAEVVLAPDSDRPTNSLADRRAILAQSQESRRAIEGLLQRFDGGLPPE